MRLLLSLITVLWLTSCAMPVVCEDRERDGGIGGTGTCAPEPPPDMLAALMSPDR